MEKRRNWRLDRNSFGSHSSLQCQGNTVSTEDLILYSITLGHHNHETVVIFLSPMQAAAKNQKYHLAQRNKAILVHVPIPNGPAMRMGCWKVWSTSLSYAQHRFNSGLWWSPKHSWVKLWRPGVGWNFLGCQPICQSLTQTLSRSQVQACFGWCSWAQL